MEYSRFWELLAKVNAAEASPEEQLEFNQAILQSAEYQNLAAKMNVFWKMSMPPADGVSEKETSRKWEQVRERIRTSAIENGFSGRPVKRRRLWLIYGRWTAAAAILIFFTGYFWMGLVRWMGHRLPAPGKMNVISTRNGSKTKVELPDGTQVWLNGGSRLVYKENFDIEDRDVQLEGEAFFDVVHDPSRPFLIHTRDMDIKVLGTSFNVQAYPNDKTSEAALIKGSIEISFPYDLSFPNQPRQTLILKPNEKVILLHQPMESDTTVLSPGTEAARRKPVRPVNLSLSSLTYQPADSSILETAWIANKLVFRSKPFEDIARDMERWYSTSIRCTDSVILNRRFTGTFSNETITEALDALKLSYPFQYRFDKQNNQVTITAE